MSNPYFVTAADVREMLADAGDDYGARSRALQHVEFCIEQGETQCGRLAEAREELARQVAMLDAENAWSLANL